MANERRSVGIFIDGKQAVNSLKEMTDEAKKLRLELANTTEGTDDFIKKSAQLQRVEKQVADLTKQYGEFEKSGKTLEGLTKRQKELNDALKADLGSDERQKLLKELGEVNKDYVKLDRILNGVADKGVVSLASLEKEQRKLANEIRHTSLEAGEYEDKVKRLRLLEANIDTHKKKIYGVEEAWKGVSSKSESGIASIQNFLGIGGIAVVASQVVSALSAVGKESVALYDTAAKVDAQLQAVLASTNQVAGRSFEQLSKQAEELQKTTLFDDEATKSGQALLLTFTKVRTEVFDKSIPLIQDYATAMALASDGNVDLKSSTIQVGKALQDPIKGITALGKAGVQFSVQQKAQIKDFVEAGRVADAQRIILGELETQFGGSAKAAAQAGLGGLQIFNNRIDNLKESLGELIVQQLEELSPAIDDAITGVEDFVAAEKSGEVATTTFGQVLQVLAKVFDLVVNGQNYATQAGVRFRLFLLEKMGPTIVEINDKLVSFYNRGVSLVNFLNEAAGLKTRFEPIDVDAFADNLQNKIKIAKQDLADLQKTATVKAPIATPLNLNNPDGGGTSNGESELKKQAERELEAQRKKSEKLLKAISEFKEDERLLTLSENERRLAEVAAKYQDEIDQAVELEKSKNQTISEAATEQKVELLRLQAEAIKAEGDKIAEEEVTALVEKLTAENETKLESELAFQESIKEIKAQFAEAGNELSTAETEEEILAAQLKYEQLKALATQFGIDITAIETDVAAKRKAEAEKLKNDLLSQENELFQAEKNVQLAKLEFMSTVAEQIGAIAGDNAAIQDAVFIFQKAVAVAQVIIELQKQLAAIRTQWAITRATMAATVAGQALIPGTYGIQVAQTTAAKIGAGISIAAIVGSTIARFVGKKRQKKEGGWASVTGEDDGQRYNARLIGQRPTGLLDYPHPVLMGSGILANEVGKEYYVSHHDLRKPAVLDHVRAIENITSHRQRAGGGFASTSPTQNVAAPGAGSDPELKQLMGLVASFLGQLLAKGVQANIGNDEILALKRQIAQLDKASGGRL